MAQELIDGVEHEVRKGARITERNALLLRGRPDSARKAAIANMAPGGGPSPRPSLVTGRSCPGPAGPRQRRTTGSTG
jgi:hypothetical protein